MQKMNYLFSLILIVVSSCGKSSEPQTPVTPVIPVVTPTGVNEVDFWLTTADKSSLLQKQGGILSFDTKANSNPTILVDSTEFFQEMDGFGATLTGGSAYVLNQKLTAMERQNALNDLFSSQGIGISYLRLSIGASDMNATAYTYDDSQTADPDLLKFSIDMDKTDMIPVLKQILAINPNIKLMSSPWSAPAWMKSNNSLIGGSLKPEYYAAYAQYFVKYIQAMQKEGIKIDAITPQNEPENPNNNPSLVMTANEQALFIKKHLGPAFKAANLTTKIVIFDHNCDNPNYPNSILNDAEAKPFIDGSAFHLYAGNINAMSQVKAAHTDKNLYFTEQYISSKGGFGGDLEWHTKNLIIGASRNYAKTVLEWNLATDEKFEPHTIGGCSECLGTITVSNNSIQKNTAYYILAHASKFVPVGSKRIASNNINSVNNVAFLTPSGKKVLIAFNDSDQAQTFNIKANNKQVSINMTKKALGTFVW
jgi:glucosylceramidase